MQKRFQTVNGDAVLEITETKEVKTRHSKRTLTARRVVLRDMQERITNEMQQIDTLLKQIDEEEAKEIKGAK